MLSPEITQKLTGKSFKTSPAILPGFKMHCVKGSDYPAIIHENGAETKGNILLNTDDEDVLILSFFEGDEYEIQKVKVLRNGKIEDALAFIWVKGQDRLENRDWDFDKFHKNSLEYYLDVVVPETLEAFKKY